MFDPATAALIASAPPLEGLDLEDLPKRLTEAFTTIVSARIRLKGGLADDPAIASQLAELRRIAVTYEAYVALLPEREDRAASSFVAGTAYHTYLLGTHGWEENGSRVTATHAAPEICSALLYLASNSKADAAEAAKLIKSQTGSPIEQALVKALADLCFGRLGAITSIGIPKLEEGAAEQRALDALLRNLLRAVKVIAARLMRRSDPPEPDALSAREILLGVKSLCSMQIADVLPAGYAVSVFPGPLHVASLLLSIDRDLISSATTRISTPPGIEEKGWWNIISRIAKQRPYLWPNHLEAIESGYLNLGISSAVSFPTGAGKSTLAELKIAAALLNKKKVIFLAPTNALVDQTAKALGQTFKSFEVFGDLTDDAFEFLVLPEVLVTTPERCLYLLSSQPDWFKDLGLLVFDECHLLHPRDTEKSRRSIDAMLAVLNVAGIAPEADLLLLSAMMKNTAEIAEWIESFTDRPCLKLDLSWKPTRQARACLVYPAARINELNALVKKARVEYPAHGDLPVAVERKLTVLPYAFFGLLQTWSTQAVADYSLQKLLDEAIVLASGTNKSLWYLTPNANKTSASIAAAASVSGTKTLIFAQSTVLCDGGVKYYGNLGQQRKIKLTDEELVNHVYAAEEMGGPEYCYLNVVDNEYEGTAASHHSLLLREERLLHESLFKRRDGLDVLFATSTLAQGMNLPSDLVIISGDSRFDAAKDKMERLEAHELLNAAGRAGRAGEAAQGVVLVIPSKVVDFDEKASKINDHWMELRAVFGQGDQCLVIGDPLTDLLDQIHAGTTETGMESYLISRLVFSAGGDPEKAARTVLARTLAVFKANKVGDRGWVDSRIAAALSARASRTVDLAPDWLERVSSSTGVGQQTLLELDAFVNNGSFPTEALKMIDALIVWTEKTPGRLFEFVRPESIEAIFGGEYKKLNTMEKKAAMALPVIRSMLRDWLLGSPLSKMEEGRLGSSKVKKCTTSRSFVTRVVPELAFIAGLPQHLHNSKFVDDDSLPDTPLTLALLRALVREGCASVEVLAIKREGARKTRVAAKRLFDELKNYIPKPVAGEDIDGVRERVQTAQINKAFDQ